MKLSLSVCLGLLLCTPAVAKDLKLKKVLPEPAHKARLGQTLEQVRTKLPNLTKAQSANEFRQVWKLEMFEGDLRAVIFYFDADLPGNPLYEVLYNFEDPNSASRLATLRLGPPNHNKDEWRLPMKGSEWELAAWVHDGKLVYAVPMKGSEWENGID